MKPPKSKQNLLILANQISEFYEPWKGTDEDMAKWNATDATINS